MKCYDKTQKIEVKTLSPIQVCSITEIKFYVNQKKSIYNRLFVPVKALNVDRFTKHIRCFL